jgi:hypothetical protein
VPDELTAAILVRPLDARAQGSAPVPEAMHSTFPTAHRSWSMAKLRRDRSERDLKAQDGAAAKAVLDAVTDALCQASPSSHVGQELCAWEYRIERSVCHTAGSCQ